MTTIHTGIHTYHRSIVTTSSELCKVLFWRCLCCLCVQISLELLNRFVTNSQGRRVWSRAQTSLKVKVNFGSLCSLCLEKHICSSFLCVCTCTCTLVMMAALCNRAGYYIFALWFLSSSSIFFSSPNLSGRRLDVYHTSTHGVALVRI